MRIACNWMCLSLALACLGNSLTPVLALSGQVEGAWVRKGGWAKQQFDERVVYLAPVTDLTREWVVKVCTSELMSEWPLLLPNGPARKSLRETAVSDDGHFRFANISPGAYYVIGRCALTSATGRVEYGDGLAHTNETVSVERSVHGVVTVDDSTTTLVVLHQFLSEAHASAAAPAAPAAPQRGAGRLEGRVYRTLDSATTVAARARSVWLYPSVPYSEAWFAHIVPDLAQLVHPPDKRLRAAAQVAQSGRDGKFSFADLTPGEYYLVSAVPWTERDGAERGEPVWRRVTVADRSAEAVQADLVAVTSASVESDAVDVEAELVSMPSADIPEAASVAGVGGSVRLALHVDVNGRVDEVKVVESIAELDRPAVDAARQSRWVPAARGGVPVASWVKYTFRFTMR